MKLRWILPLIIIISILIIFVKLFFFSPDLDHGNEHKYYRLGYYGSNDSSGVSYDDYEVSDFIELFTKNCKMGNYRSCKNLAYIYEIGEEEAVEVDKKKAVDLYEKALSLYSNNKFNLVRLFSVTDRRNIRDATFFLDDWERNVSYEGKRGDSISYDKVIVSIPHSHKIERVESKSIFDFQLSKNPENHLKILFSSHLIGRWGKPDFFDHSNIFIKNKVEKNALIFFHGYNVSYENAAIKTAQITYDLKFNGVTFFYSWPSVGEIAAYTEDEANIKWSEKNIEKFLLDLSQKTSVENIYIIAHSMGSRGLTRAIANLLRKKPSLSHKFKELILAAPDIDADIFKNEILPEITKWKIPVTLYASTDDKALLLSKKVHGYPRAGDAGENILIAKGMETIDVTGVDTSYLAHSYFSEKKSVLSDIFSITSQHLRADDRFSLRRSKNKKYWVFRK